jgi:branched-chain amino acid transport system substrate-binding protein
MRKLAVTALLSVPLVASAAGCGGSGKNGGASAATSASHAGKQNGPVVIGAAIALSGFMSAYDGPSFAGFKLKIDQVNAAGGLDGRRIKLITADTKSEIPQGGVAARQLIQEGAQIMLTTCDFDYGSSAAVAAQSAGMVSVSLCAQSPKFGVQGIGDKAYTFSESGITEGATLATFAYQKQGYRKTFVLLDNSVAYDQDDCMGYEEAFKKLGGSIAGSAIFKNSDSSVATQIASIQSSKADSIIACTYPPGGASALRQLRAAGVDLPVLAGDGMDGTYWVKAVPHLNNLYVSTQASMFGDDPSAAVNTFVKVFKQATGGPPPTAFAAVGYSDAQALVAAVEKTGGATGGADLSNALNQFHNQPLLVGPTSFTSEVHIPLDRPMAIVRYTNGKPAYVTTVKTAVPVGLTAVAGN